MYQRTPRRSLTPVETLRPWRFRVSVALVCCSIGTSGETSAQTSYSASSAGAPTAALDASIESPATPGPHPPLPLPGWAAWGNLEITEILLDNHYAILSDPNLNKLPSRWFFKGRNKDSAMAILRASGLTERQLDQARECFVEEPNKAGVSLLPEAAWVLGLKPEAHSSVAFELSRSLENQHYFRPYARPTPQFNAWLYYGELSAASRPIVASAAYPQGPFTCISDKAELFTAIANQDDRRHIARFLSTRRSLSVRLHLGPDSNLDALAEYWGRGGRIRQTLPLLEAHARNPETAHIDIVNLLPPFARQSLNTYPASDSRENCFWTSLNFFNNRAIEGFVDVGEAAGILERDYHQIPAATWLGDLILLLDHTNMPLHSMVFIAEDIVFTKNGIGDDIPWSLGKFAEITASYLSNAPHGIRVQIHRRKSASTSARSAGK
ncbi:MAG: hypothetical protein ACI9VS_000596 [Candidatus Binatia bacterium]|jgi:hypothetical protein